MRKRAVGDVRQGAERIRAQIELEQIYAIATQYRTRDRHQTPPFRTDTEVRVMARSVEGGLEVRAKYVTDAYKDLEDNKTRGVWHVEVECVAAFESVDETQADYSEDDLEAFAVMVGTPAIHPYAREYTQLLTSQSQYPAFTIGLLNSPQELPDHHEIEFPDRAVEDADTALEPSESEVTLEGSHGESA